MLAVVRPLAQLQFFKPFWRICVGSIWVAGGAQVVGPAMQQYADAHHVCTQQQRGGRKILGSPTWANVRNVLSFEQCVMRVKSTLPFYTPY